jgi:hypothetical protein
MALKDLLAQRGISTAWTLQNANAITPDSRVIVGTGVAPNGYTDAWRVVLP